MGDSLHRPSTFGIHVEWEWGGQWTAGRPAEPVQEQQSGTRTAGVLHPPVCRERNPLGRGKECHGFLDWLESTGCSAWQVLPLCQTGPGQSPYSSPASFVGNPYLIDAELLFEDGLLSEEELASLQPESISQLDYKALLQRKKPLLHAAAERFLSNPSHRLRQAFLQFEAASSWLEDTALFLAISEQQNQPWWLWPTELRDREAETLTRVSIELFDAVQREKVLAFFFDHQWSAIRRAAEARQITLIGDLPLYVAHDSADVWIHREMFELGADGRPDSVAGVPPDAFSDTGQLWGNPLFRWDKMEGDGFHWWKERPSESC